MRARRLSLALEALQSAMAEVNSAIEEMRAEHDPLASYIFVSRREYRATQDTKGGRRREMSARLSYHEAVSLGFRGSLDDWEGAATGGRSWIAVSSLLRYGKQDPPYG